MHVQVLPANGYHGPKTVQYLLDTEYHARAMLLSCPANCLLKYVLCQSLSLFPASASRGMQPLPDPPNRAASIATTDAAAGAPATGAGAGAVVGFVRFADSSGPAPILAHAAATGATAALVSDK